MIKTAPIEEVLVIKLSDWETLNLSNYVFEKTKVNSSQKILNQDW